MRPRKIVLIIDTSPINLSLRSFVLHNWGYKPIKAQGAIEAMKMLEARKAYSVDLIMVGDGITVSEVMWIAEQTKDMLQVCPIYGAGMEVGGNELREGVKEKVARKRGPKAKPMLELETAA